jgi:hypothetical protein
LKPPRHLDLQREDVCRAYYTTEVRCALTLAGPLWTNIVADGNQSTPGRELNDTVGELPRLAEALQP